MTKLTIFRRVGRVLAIGVLCAAWGMASATWPELGRPVSTAPGNQDLPKIVSDGAGGAVITWHDPDNPAVNIFAQHVRVTGDLDASWPVNGRSLLTDPAALAGAFDGQTSPVIATDGAGGAIVAWEDGRSSVTQTDIFAQHVLASGVVDVAWPANGAALVVIAGLQFSPAIVSDGAGGAIVTWMDTRPGATKADLFAQHVLASGRVDARWPSNGLAVSTAAGGQASPSIAGDGAGGAIIAWDDGRNATSGVDIFAQHVLNAGVVDPAWPVNGRALCLAAGDQFSPTIVSDGVHGAIVAWQDARDGGNDIYAQRVTGTGAIATGWPVNGRALCTAPQEQIGPVVTADGGSGAIVTWLDLRNGLNHNPFAQHVLASGLVDAAWPANGRALGLSARDETSASIVADAAGGAIVSWEEDSVVVAQHVQASGLLDPTFPANGRVVRPVVSVQRTPDLAIDGAGNAIVAWSDIAPASTSDIFAMQVLVGCGASSTLPAEVDNSVRASKASGSAAVLTWNIAAGVVSSDVLRGHVSGLPVGSGRADEQCLADSSAIDTFADRDLPAAGDTFWYLIRVANACGTGPYGFEEIHGASPLPRQSPTCP
jgi:hypothetical protein